MNKPPTHRPSASRRLSRRSLLKRSAAVGVVAAAGAGGAIALGHGGRYPDPVPACTLVYLARREYAILAALSDSLFPTGNRLGLSGTEARVPEYIDRMLSRMDPHKAAEFRSMLLLFEHGTLAFGLRVRRFTARPQKAREKYLRRWETARVYSRRMLAIGLKTMLGIAYFAHPEVQARLGIQRACATPADASPRQEWS